MTDVQKVKEGRVLSAWHKQNNARVKIVVKKLEASEWPAGTESYKICLKDDATSGKVEIAEKEWLGASKKITTEIVRTELEKEDKVFWLQGVKETTKARDIKLDLALDRPTGGASKTIKRNADWARFTVVKIDDVKVDYKAEDGCAVAWNEKDERFYINLKSPDVDGRKITIGAQLSEKIKDVIVHFMLVEDKDNGKAANWGIDLPIGGKLPGKDYVYSIVNDDNAISPDHDKFEIRNDIEIFIEDGVLDHTRQDRYTVIVKATDGDGVSYNHQKVSYSVMEWGLNGENTAGGKNYIDVNPIGNTNVPLWKWDEISAVVKHKDKTERKKVIHLSATTDENGYAKKELTLSRFGGDKFQPACYIEQDAHLAKYIDGHEELSKKVPVFSKKSISVWRKIWFQKVVVENMVSRDLSPSIAEYERIKVEMVDAGDLEIPRATVDTFTPQAIYPRHMIRVNGGNDDALVVSDTNKAQFFTDFKPEKDKPNKIPILVCDAQWDKQGNSASSSPGKLLNLTDFPYDLDVGKEVLNPTLQGVDLYVSGRWKAKNVHPVTNAVTDLTSGDLTNAQLSINPNRASLKHVTIALPDAVDLGPTDANTRIEITNVRVKAAKSYLGESSVVKAEWTGDGNTDAKSPAYQSAANFPFKLDMGKPVISPPAQGGNLFVSGDWKAGEWDAAANGGVGELKHERTGSLTNADISIDKYRISNMEVLVALPAGVGPTTEHTRVYLENVILKAGKRKMKPRNPPFVSPEDPVSFTLAVFNPDEVDDFQNTIVHELGHAYHQVIRGNPAGGTAGIARHPRQADEGQGNHCRHLGHRCVMFDSGPVLSSLNRYCDVCQPYLLVQDMSTVS